MVISCDRCNARLDLGPVAARHTSARRTPSGWLATGDNTHVCGLCSSGYMSSTLRRYW